MKHSFIFVAAGYMHHFNGIIYSLLRGILFMIFNIFAVLKLICIYYRFGSCFYVLREHLKLYDFMKLYMYWGWA
jgi:hypothetical protein